MANYRLSHRARRDLIEIWAYIAGDSEVAADRFIDRLVGGFSKLGQNPFLGRSRDDLRPGSRSFLVGQYVIVYVVAAPGVRILHVFQGKRDLPALFGH
jgi:toxin ParE1/3/4